MIRIQRSYKRFKDIVLPPSLREWDERIPTLLHPTKPHDQLIILRLEAIPDLYKGVMARGAISLYINNLLFYETSSRPLGLLFYENLAWFLALQYFYLIEQDPSHPDGRLYPNLKRQMSERRLRDPLVQAHRLNLLRGPLALLDSEIDRTSEWLRALLEY